MDNKELNNLKQAEETVIVTRNSLDGTSALSDADNPIDPATKVSRTPRISQNPAIEINPFLLAGLLFGVILIWLIIVSLKELFHTNPYGEQIRIDNFNRFFSEMSNEDRDSIFNSLYSIAKSNTPEDTTLPEKGAEIRAGSTNTEYNTENDTYTSTFLVDVPDLQQTYNFWVYWSTNPNNTNVATAGYTVTALCPTKDQLIYPEFECSDMQNSQGVTNDKILTSLPIKKSYYINNYDKYIDFSISAQISDNASLLTIIITSYSQYTEENYSAALNVLREAGFNPDDYKIKYIDAYYSYQTPGRAD